MESTKDNFNLRLRQNPYLIEYNPDVMKAIDVSISNGLHDYYDIDSQFIDEYRNKKKPLPIWILEAACNVNSKHHLIPINHQNIWYCLNNAVVTRSQPSGRIFQSRVCFSPCYIDVDETIKKVFIDTLNKLGTSQSKFSLLCGYKVGTTRIINKKIPITAILKICQVLKLDIWQLLKGHKLFGKTSKTGTIIIPEKEQDPDILVLLTWIKTEGHLTLSHPSIEINQKNDMKSLKEIQRIIKEKFRLKKCGIFAIGKRGDDRLIISSSSLRQFLCLKHQIPIGYKSNSLERMNINNLSDECCQKIMAAFIQTEGCLSYNYTRNKKKKLPKFEFIVKDQALAEDCLMTLQKMGFNPTYHHKQNVYKVGLYNSKQVIDLINLTKNYFFNTKKISYLKEVCTSGIGL